MTCVIGMLKGDKVVMGADSAGVAGDLVTQRKDPKVFKNGPYLIGYTSSFRMGQLLMYTALPEPRKNAELFKFMVQEFVPAIRGIFDHGGFARKESNQERAGIFLVGIKGRLFKVESDYQVAESLDPYNSVGCGRDFALGSMFGLQNSRKTPEEKVQLSLEAAEKYSSGVSGPFTVLTN